MRELTGHIVNPANDKIKIQVMDEPGQGGACHHYQVFVDSDPFATQIVFQNGPIAEFGVNGLTHEVLVAILVDRLEHFQNGPYRCDENEEALQDLLHAQASLHDRTKARMARNVEGTHQV